ncbi:MAG: sulfurtransferase [Rhodospirillales bacterium]|nr:MAG: sulfurtransferase [Rhodospirillales bacterium]
MTGVTESRPPTPLCSTAWLAQHLEDPRLRLVDGSFHLPGSGRDPRAEFRHCRIPGARFFDIDAVCDPVSPLPHMQPPPELFAGHVAGLGIGSEHFVVAYDAPGSCAAARVWWSFRLFGHDGVAVLDGGLAKWVREGRPVDETPPGEPPAPLPAAEFRAEFRPHLLRLAQDLLANLATGREQVVDNRSAGRFAGVESEPRPAAKAGHIPGSVNLPFSSLLNPEDGTWRPPGELAERFAAAGIDLDRPMVGTCGSGVTACTTAFAAFLLGRDDVAVYDGSWAEWGNRHDTPVER